MVKTEKIEVYVVAIFSIDYYFFLFLFCLLQSVIEKERRGDYLGKTVQV